ncbi:hypothetical protein SAMN05444172_2587 [Burkholderia sp. GAS332]|nr:hypothetical protein SAMN05444172_2587 [Burkholderia sp. GAS332]
MSLRAGTSARTNPTAFMENDEGNELFGPKTQTEISNVVQVQDEPIVIRAHHLDIGERVLVEMVDGAGAGEHFSPYMRNGCQVALTRKCNLTAIAMPGRYRFVLEGTLGVAYVRYFRASMTHEFLLELQQMGCCGESPTTLPPSGPAGGVLTGNYPNPDLNPVVAADQLSKDDNAMTILAKPLCEKLQPCLVAAFVDCNGKPHLAGDAIPSCDEMEAAIAAAVPKLLDCNGNVLVSGDHVPTCAQMAAAIDAAAPKLLDCNGAHLEVNAHVATCDQVDDKITAAIGKIPADKFLEIVGYDPKTHTLTFTVSNGGPTFTVDLSDLLPIVVGPGLKGDGTVGTPADIKLKPSGGLVVSSAGVAVQPDTTAAPAANAGTDLPTTVYGGRTALLAAPDGWLNIDGKRVPFWN